MNSKHLLRRIDHTKSELDGIIDDLCLEIENLESENSSMKDEIVNLNERIRELEGILMDNMSM